MPEKKKRRVRDYLIECKDKCLFVFVFLHASQNKGTDDHEKCAQC
jgi:hypothetical protein